MTSKRTFVLLFFLHLVVLTISKCSFSVSKEMMPFKYDGDSFKVNFTMATCK